jgi:hypothetical protein
LVAVVVVVFLNWIIETALMQHMLLAQLVRQRPRAFLRYRAGFQPFLFLGSFLVDELHDQNVLTEPFERFFKFLVVGIDDDLASFLVSADIVTDISDAVLIDLPIIFVKIDESGQTVVSFEHIDLLMDDIDLFGNEIADVSCFFSIVDLKLPIPGNCFAD